MRLLGRAGRVGGGLGVPPEEMAVVRAVAVVCGRGGRGGPPGRRLVPGGGACGARRACSTKQRVTNVWPDGRPRVCGHE